jgi:alpha-glucosidase
MKDVMKFWFDIGVDGFRLDAVNFLWKHKGFQDAPPNPKYVEGEMEPYLKTLPLYSKDQKEVFTLLKDLSEFAKNHGDKILLTEAYPDDRGADSILFYKKYYDRMGSNFCIPFNFEFIFMAWDAETYKSFVNAYLNALDNNHIPVFVLGNHDRSRLATRIGTKQARTAAMLLLALPGIPIIYNGDEIGMHDVEIPLALQKDPYGIKYPGFGRDPERTPLQWDDSKNAGFTKGKPWLPIAKDYKKINVKKQVQDKHSILNLYKSLTQLRKSSNAILKGTYKSLQIDNKNIYGFIREYKNEKIVVLLNFSNKKQNLSLQLSNGILLYNSFLDQKSSEKIDLNNLSLRANEGCIFSI